MKETTPTLEEKRRPTEPPVPAAPPVVRSILGGFLMGLANLVPGVSGGTMIVVVGLYDEFVTSLADVTRLRLNKRSLLFLGLIGLTAAAVVLTLAGTVSRAVHSHRSAMFSLFIGMTLGGAPVLYRMLEKLRARSIAGVGVGLGIMVAIAMTNEGAPASAAVKDALSRGQLIVEPDYARDVLAGALGMSAMVLPGISGAYMLLILGRYETILAAVSLAKDYGVSIGDDGDPAGFLSVLIPCAVGAVIGLVGLSNVLKWMLRNHRDATLGLLLGILLGSVVGIWPYNQSTSPGDWMIGAVLAIAGFTATTLLSRVEA